MMRNDENRIYRSFEEFEREELRQLESLGASLEDMIESLFGGTLEAGGARGFGEDS